MDPHDTMEGKSEQGNNREDPCSPESPTVSETPTTVRATSGGLIYDQDRPSRSSLGAIMAQLPEWANELTGEALRTILRGLNLNTSGVGEVLQQRMGRYFARQGVK